jgi:MFS family permease
MALGVLALCTLISTVSRGVTDCFAVFLLPIGREFGVDRASITGVQSIYLLVLGTMSPLAGIVFDRLGPRACYALGLALFGGACIAAGSATAAWHVQLAIGLGGASGATLIGTLPAASLLSRWFQTRLQSAVSAMYASMGAGMLAFAPLTQWLIDLAGWRSAYRTLGGMTLVLLAIVLALPWRRIAAGAASVAGRRSTAPAGAAGWNVRAALRAPAFWTLFGVLFCTSVSTYSVSVQLVAYLVESGFAPLRAASVFGTVGLVSIVGMLGTGALAERIGERRVAMLSYGATILGVGALALVSHGPSTLALAAYVLLFGTMQGSRGPLVAVLSARQFAGPSQARIYGAILFGMGSGGALGSWASGALYDLTGSYLGGFALSAAAAACGLALFLRVPEAARR